MTLTLPELLENARAAGLDPAEGAAGFLDRLAVLLVTHGERFALLSRGDLDRDVIVSKHFGDALDGLLFSRPGRNASVLDFGAGGGPVGFAWSILRPDLSVTLLESKRRKARFMRTASKDPAQPAVHLAHGSAEPSSVTVLRPLDEAKAAEYAVESCPDGAIVQVQTEVPYHGYVVVEW